MSIKYYSWCEELLYQELCCSLATHGFRVIFITTKPLNSLFVAKINDNGITEKRPAGFGTCNSLYLKGFDIEAIKSCMISQPVKSLM